MSDVSAEYRVVQLHNTDPAAASDNSEQRKHAMTRGEDITAAMCGILPIHTGWSWRASRGEVTCPRCLQWLSHAQQRARALEIIAAEGSARTATVADRLGVLPATAYQMLRRLQAESRVTVRKVARPGPRKVVGTNEWCLAQEA